MADQDRARAPESAGGTMGQGADHGAATAADGAELGAIERGPIERGTYEIIRERLLAQAGVLRQKAAALNEERLAVFGGQEMRVLGQTRIRTEQSCVPRDVVELGERQLIGFNVQLGLKREMAVGDVFAVHRFEETEEGYRFQQEAADFLEDPGFQADFQELFQYYAETELLQLRHVEDRLLAVFRIGPQLHDIRVFRWVVDPEGRARYLDDRGERDHAFPPSHDFEWTPVGRDDFLSAPHLHASILDRVFVDTRGGRLTLRVDDGNRRAGRAILREPLREPDQALDDAEIGYSRVGDLVLLRVRPFREEDWRHYVFDGRAQRAERVDEIGQACLRLPEDHGLIFPGGFYLQTGAMKRFEGDNQGAEFKRTLRSPNGEDVLYVFHRRADGLSILLPYNLIRKEVATPIRCHGFSVFEDGKMVVFRAAREATRVHPMQVWQTPFVSDEHAARQPEGDSFLAKVGNAELVRGISDALSIVRLVEEQEPSAEGYEALAGAVGRAFDAYFWLDEEDAGDLGASLREIADTAEAILDEFEKVEAIRLRSAEALAEAEAAQGELLRSLRPESWHRVDEHVAALGELRRQQGRLIGLRELRYMDLARVDALEAEVVARFEEVSARTVAFLAGEEAFAPYRARTEEVASRVDELASVAESEPLRQELQETQDGLQLLAEIVGGLEVEDATERTAMLEAISEVLAGLNRARARLEGRRQALLRREGMAEFGAQFTVLGQRVTAALAVADTPERCDAELASLLLALEDMESRFAELEDFQAQLETKREEIYQAFEARKQAHLDAQARRAEQLGQAGSRILAGLEHRAERIEDDDGLHAFFASDPMVGRLRVTAERLRELGDPVRAEELEASLLALRQRSGRALRDRSELFEGAEDAIRLGSHRFAVHSRALDLSLLPREGGMALHLSGTDFYEALQDEAFEAFRPYWEQRLVSETDEVYRGEYLAASLLMDAERGAMLDGERLDMAALLKAAGSEAGLLPLLRRYAEPRYDEGYERGVHDEDAAAILARLIDLLGTAELLRYGPAARARAQRMWLAEPDEGRRARWQRRAASLRRLGETFQAGEARAALAAELAEAQRARDEAAGRPATPALDAQAADYLVQELGREPLAFLRGGDAADLCASFLSSLDGSGARRDFDGDLEALTEDEDARVALAGAWLEGYLASGALEGALAEDARHALPEAALLLALDGALPRRDSHARTRAAVEGLLGQHPRIREGVLDLRLDELLGRLARFRAERVPGFRAYQRARHARLEAARERLRIGDLEPKVMSAFVRNGLIDQVYLPLIADNMAKQIGALGEGKRTDLQGLLLLISPPGYGKTTLMEYLADRLGMAFVKVNGPALGQSVTSLDPAEAPNATARQEIERANFAFEMGSNVLLYLDDIQHTSPELLQKFISLCDAQRRIEGVWRGRTKTYDLRGKRFLVCMAGNPYTESGERFQVPDMLANRADIYNLGDILQGREALFQQSYLENGLTSNPILAPLSTRSRSDLLALLRMAAGEPLQADQLEHPYSAAELEEILSVLGKATQAREVVLAVNRAYIASAAQEDAYRREPPFQLQGSYRDMNKLMAKILPVMNDEELEALIDDHYAGEAQALTSGAEQNLLKLAELRGRLSPEQAERWAEIKRGYARLKAQGGDEDDPVTRVTGTIGLVAARLEEISARIEAAGRPAALPAARAEARAEAEPPSEEALEEARERALAELGDEADAVDPETIRMVTRHLADLYLGLAAVGETLARVAQVRRGDEGDVREGDGD